jgi:hypothetical protein
MYMIFSLSALSQQQRCQPLAAKAKRVYCVVNSSSLTKKPKGKHGKGKNVKMVSMLVSVSVFVFLLLPHSSHHGLAVGTNLSLPPSYVPSYTYQFGDEPSGDELSAGVSSRWFCCCFFSSALCSNSAVFARMPDAGGIWSGLTIRSNWSLDRFEGRMVVPAVCLREYALPILLLRAWLLLLVLLELLKAATLAASEARKFGLL